MILCKEEYGTPGLSEYRKNMSFATYSLSEKCGVACHKIVSSSKKGNQFHNQYIQELILSILHQVHKGQQCSRSYDFMDIHELLLDWMEICLVMIV